MNSPDPRSLPPPSPGTPPAVHCARRVAVLSDVHGNVPALRAVLAEPDVAAADTVVFTGDLTWGPDPVQTLAIVTALGERAMFLRGNADRAVLELDAEGVRDEDPYFAARDAWMLAEHPREAVDFLARMPFTLVVEIEGLGRVRFCHGSPRSDEELLTPGTPAERVAQIAATTAERVLVHGHTHIQYTREVAGMRVTNPGSVGLPYHDGAPGTAYWALLGPGVELRTTAYEVADELDRFAATGIPTAEKLTGYLMNPPTPAEVTADAEERVFSG